jgi:valyl-tRNA synthetase
MTTEQQGPPQELAKAYDPSAIEEKWAKYWADEQLFDVAAPAPGSKTWTLLLPPPNVTGRLHMGHMLNQTEMDILTRWHRMRGETALWIPGTDHAGIATQMMVEKQLAAEGGPDRKTLGREAFTERVWTWKRQYGGAITDQMRRLGASVDWSREYFTMDDDLSAAVVEAFVRLYEQGLIYRGAYIVNWDPVLQTAVSDLEVESEERVGKLYSVRYPLADGSGSIVIATTRPETMLGDVAVAVNPADERYATLVGRMLRLPLSGVDGGPEREIPVIADDWANPEFGTGAVKVTPAHDPNDFAIGKRHGLANLTILDATAHVLLPGSPYNGLDRFEARRRIVTDLEVAGLLVQVKDHNSAVPVSQRSGSVIEPRLSDQWFLAVNKAPEGGGPSIAERAIAAVRDGDIQFTPDNYAKTYFEWMGNIHDWCLSRQLWWGHRIPAWHCAQCGQFVVARSAPAACGSCGSTELTQETDVLDTWFSSGLLPFTVFGWPSADEKPTADMAAFYPTDLLVTGFDILFFWVARMIMLGTHFMAAVPMPDGSARPVSETVPFRHVYIHGLVRDADKQKMSKTKGNVIDPIGIIERFGTDAVRFTLASMASPGTDIAFNEDRTDGYRAFANKIWNAFRFVQMQVAKAGGLGVFDTEGEPRSILAQLPAEVPLETRWIVSRLSGVCREVDRALAVYRFDEAANAIYQFFWGELCDWYLELIKVRLDVGDEQQTTPASMLTLRALLGTFSAALRLLSPFMPFLTEELWHSSILLSATSSSTAGGAIALTRFPQAEDFPVDGAAEREMASLQELIVSIRAVRKELVVPEKESVPVRVYSSVGVAELAMQHADLLARMARVAIVEVAPAGLMGAGVRSTSAFDVQVVYERQIDVPAERERLTKELAKYEKGLASAEKQLGNETFMSKAPAHIVDGLRRQAEETRALRAKAQAGLDALG